MGIPAYYAGGTPAHGQFNHFIAIQIILKLPTSQRNALLYIPARLCGMMHVPSLTPEGRCHAYECMQMIPGCRLGCDGGICSVWLLTFKAQTIIYPTEITLVAP